MRFNNSQKSRLGFTLLELVMAIGIVAILGATSVVVLNPAQIFKQGRDTNRVTDLQSINRALIYYRAAGGSSFGSNNTIYVSLPDTSATCANIGLPTPPAGWSYACKPAASFRNVNGTGWIPVDFTGTQATVGNLFSSLPIDPTNTLSGDYYYTYIYGSWTLSATMESAKYLASIAATDGGVVATRFEVGNDLSLNSNITAGGGLSSAKAITAFSFASPAATGVVTEGTHTVAITVPNGTNVTALVPTITISAAASVSPASGVAQNFTNPVTYTVTAENGTTQAYVVTVTVAPPLSSAKAITAFSFASPAETGVVTEGTYTIAISVTNGTNVTALVPTIAISAAASVSPASGVAQNFTNPVTYTVTAENGTTQAYVVTVTVRAAIGTATSYYGTGPGAFDIAFDGTNMWEINNGGTAYISKFTPTGTRTDYALPGATPYGVAFDGVNMWVVNNGHNSITKVTPAGAMTTYTGTGSNPAELAFDGTNMWTVNSISNSVTKVTPSGVMTSYGPLGGNYNAGIAFDGTNMWTANNTGNSVSKITPAGVITQYSGTGANPQGIAFDGTNMWTANYNGNSVTKVSPSGVMTTYAGTGANPPNIAFNNITGDMWTANYTGNSVTRITPTGTMTTFPITGAAPHSIAFDGTNMWTADYTSNTVTKIVAR